VPIGARELITVVLFIVVTFYVRRFLNAKRATITGVRVLIAWKVVGLFLVTYIGILLGGMLLTRGALVAVARFLLPFPPLLMILASTFVLAADNLAAKRTIAIIFILVMSINVARTYQLIRRVREGANGYNLQKWDERKAREGDVSRNTADYESIGRRLS